MLAAPLSAEDMVVQSMPDVSPTKWHLAHTTWFFETFILQAFDPDYKVFDNTYNYLFNSYYELNGLFAPADYQTTCHARSLHIRGGVAYHRPFP